MQTQQQIAAALFGLPTTAPTGAAAPAIEGAHPLRELADGNNGAANVIVDGMRNVALGDGDGDGDGDVNPPAGAAE